MATDVIRVTDLTKHFTIRTTKSVKERLLNGRRGRLFDRQFDALNHVTLDIPMGQSVGLVGPNGSGKSTLLKIVGGIIAPSSGQVLTRGRIAALLELGTGFHPDLTGRENIFLNASILGLTKSETARHFDDIVDFSGIPNFIDTQVKFYSSGMYVRLAFAVAVHVDPDILLVDEVLAVGDEPYQEKCMAKIRQFQQEGRTIVFVSHSANQVANVCDRAIVLEHGKIVEDDVPLVALGRLKRDYQATITANHQADASQQSPLKARLGNVFLTDNPPTNKKGKYQIVPGPGATLQVHGEITADDLPAGWALKVAVETGVGQQELTVDSSENLHLETPAVQGRLPWMLTLPALNLADGEHAVNVKLVDADGKLIAESQHAALLCARNDKRTTGLVYSPAEIAFGDDAIAGTPLKPLPAVDDD